MKKRIGIYLLLLVMIVSLSAGCSSSSAPPVQNDNKGYESAATSAAGGPGGAGTPASIEDAIDKKIIRNADMDLEAADVETAYREILEYAAGRGGYESQRSLRKSNGYVSLTAEIRIAPDQLDGLIEYAGSRADVINSNLSSQDITEAYYDIMTRLSTMEKSLDKYYDFLNDADNIAEILQVQTQINQLTVEIESMKGKLKLWDSQLAESRLTLEIRQSDDPVRIKKEIDWAAISFSDMGYLIQLGFTRVGNVIIGGVQWILIVLAAASPLWITGLVIFLVLRRKKLRRKALLQVQAQPETIVSAPVIAEQQKPDDHP